MVRRSLGRSGEVEDYAFVTLRTPSGILCHNEVGYTLPTWPRNAFDREQKVASQKALVVNMEQGVKVMDADGEKIIPAPPGYVAGYRRLVLETLHSLDRGEAPPVAAENCARAVALIHEAYAIAGQSSA